MEKVNVKELSLEELKKLVLEDKVVKIKPIVRSKPYLKKGHDGEHTFTGCYKSHGLTYKASKRAYVNPFKTEQEQEIFEKLLDQKPGALNLYKFNVNEPNFWGSFELRISKEGEELNLMNPSDALMYRVLLVNPKFAKNNRESTIASKEYMIVDEQEEKEIATALGLKKDKANDYMFKIKKSKKKMYDALRLMGKKPDINADIDWFKSELYKILDEVSTNKGISGLDKFIATQEDSQAELKLVIMDAIQNEDIVLDKVGYKFTDSNKFIGRKFNDVVLYFSSNKPEVKEEFQILKERLKA